MFAQMKRQMKRVAAAVVLLLGAAQAPTMAQSQDFKLGQSLEVEYSVLKEVAQS